MDLYLAWVVISELLTFVQKYGITISLSSCSFLLDLNPPSQNAWMQCLHWGGGQGWRQLRAPPEGCLAFLGYEGLSVFRIT